MFSSKKKQQKLKQNKNRKNLYVRSYKYFPFSTLVRPKFSSIVDGQD